MNDRDPARRDTDTAVVGCALRARTRYYQPPSVARTHFQNLFIAPFARVGDRPNHAVDEVLLPQCALAQCQPLRDLLPIVPDSVEPRHVFNAHAISGQRGYEALCLCTFPDLNSTLDSGPVESP